MQVTIWDLDWFYKITNIPNVDCMKLSSYHKQKGDNINFVTDITQLNLIFDRLYIARESEQTEVPNIKILNDKRTFLLGNGFKYYGAKVINKVVASCRPDYLLYNIDKKNPYANANFLQFYCGKELLIKRQDFHNTFKHHKKTLVVDKYFWSATDEEILYCLNELKKEKNVAFLKPISLAKILTSKKIRENFLELNFTVGTVFKWKNDYGNGLIAIQTIVDFMLELRNKTHSNLGIVPITREVPTDYEESNIDLAEIFTITKIFKQNKLKCLIKFTGTSVLQFVYNNITKWTEYDFSLSFVEHTIHLQSMIEGLDWYEVLNNHLKWRNKDLDWLLYILIAEEWENYQDCLLLQWGENMLNSKLINKEIIKEHLSLYYGGIDE